MPDNIEIGDALLAEAMALTGLPSEKDTVEAALLQLVRDLRRRAATADMAGMGWEGDLDAMREGRDFGPPY